VGRAGEKRGNASQGGVGLPPKGYGKTMLDFLFVKNAIRCEEEGL